VPFDVLSVEQERRPMTLTPKNRSSSSTSSQIVQSSDTEFQIPHETITAAEVKLQEATFAGIKVEIRRDVKLTAMKRITEYVIAVTSLLFLGTAAETFLPSTTRLVEGSLLALLRGL
jgi:hypothetical protein